MSNVINIIEDLKKHLINNFGETIKDVILFGSQANGNQNPFSDYDVLIIVKKEFSETEENQILDKCYDINLKYDIILDVHIFSINEINTIRGKQPLFMNALKKGIYA